MSASAPAIAGYPGMAPADRVPKSGRRTGTVETTKTHVMVLITKGQQKARWDRPGVLHRLAVGHRRIDNLRACTTGQHRPAGAHTRQGDCAL